MGLGWALALLLIASSRLMQSVKSASVRGASTAARLVAVLVAGLDAARGGDCAGAVVCGFAATGALGLDAVRGYDGPEEMNELDDEPEEPEVPDEPVEPALLYVKGFWRRARLAEEAARRMSRSGSFLVLKRFWRNLSAASLVATMDSLARKAWARYSAWCCSSDKLRDSRREVEAEGEEGEDGEVEAESVGLVVVAECEVTLLQLITVAAPVGWGRAVGMSAASFGMADMGSSEAEAGRMRGRSGRGGRGKNCASIDAGSALRACARRWLLRGLFRSWA